MYQSFGDNIYSPTIGTMLLTQKYLVCSHIYKHKKILYAVSQCGKKRNIPRQTVNSLEISVNNL